MPASSVTSTKRGCGSRREIVAIEPVFERLVDRLARSEQLALHQVDVEVAVIVVVEERRTGAGDLGHIELAGHTVEVYEVEAAFGGHVAERRPSVDCRAVVGRRRCGLLGTAQGHQQSDSEKGR